MGKLCERMGSSVELRRLHGETTRIEFFSHLGLSCSIRPCHFCDLPSRHFRFVPVKRPWTSKRAESYSDHARNLSQRYRLYHDFLTSDPKKFALNLKKKKRKISSNLVLIIRLISNNLLEKRNNYIIYNIDC